DRRRLSRGARGGHATRPALSRRRRHCRRAARLRTIAGEVRRLVTGETRLRPERLRRHPLSAGPGRGALRPVATLTHREAAAPSPDLSKSRDRIASMFDAISGRYDFLNHLLSGGIDRRWRTTAIRSLRLSGRERVLDLCT